MSLSNSVYTTVSTAELVSVAGSYLTVPYDTLKLTLTACTIQTPIDPPREQSYSLIAELIIRNPGIEMLN